MVIIGISNSSHGSSAAIVVNGIIVAAAEEERFDRVKNSDNFPINSIKFCLKKARKKIDEVNEIGVSMDFLKRAQSRFNFNFDLNDVSRCISAKKQAERDIKKRIDTEKHLREKLKYKGKIFFLDHHDCHAATSYFTSSFDKSAILTIDGSGEKDSTRIYKAKENQIKKIYSFQFPNSLGALYSLITAYLGFDIDSGEGKVMGLAPYGDFSLLKKFRKIIKIDEEGRYKIKSEWFDFLNESFIKEFREIIGFSKRTKVKIEQKHKNLAFAAQKALEESILGLVNFTKNITKENNLCLGGGVILNSVANGRIVKEKIFKNVFLYPASGDSGTAVGGALYLYNIKKQKKVFYKKNQSPYLGYKTFKNEIIKTIVSFGLDFKELNDVEVKKKIAYMISKNKIVGYFAGRAEFGPRALGNRSILAHPKYFLNKERINKKIKFRENFRPFAPAILEEFSDKYFDNYGFESPYMILAFKVKKGRKKDISACVHVDQTSRVQTVRKDQSESFWKIIKEFYTITQIPILLNTSFNVAGDPIVNTPKEAVETFLNTDLDVLVLENFIVFKKFSR